jgi:Na+/melibiose symporter-like transporter
MSQTIAFVDFRNSKEVENIFKQQQKNVVTVKKQTPYTLLMMRVVEIGIPVLLSIFSLMFIFRYTLTEKRSLEIKELLKAKNTPNP